ncbi:MAG: hypothetical protein C0596_15560 [Marinilabiliales bacterium]|nr:MAG: hypothetical protein C0596_15560 [Marinilabiliales bacterium]
MINIQDIKFSAMKNIVKSGILVALIFCLTIGIEAQEDRYVYHLNVSIDIGAIENLEVYFVVEDEKEEPNALMYVPAQFIYEMPAHVIRNSEDSTVIYIKRLGAEFIGFWDHTIDSYVGMWKQGNQDFPAVSTQIRTSEMSFIERPQTPQPPYQYIQKDICIENKKGDCKLCGTLTIPDTLNSYPLAILITGSGAQDRNEEIAGHQPFKVIADHLTRNGIAVFRYDDRGFGESTGNIMKSTTYDFMTDAAAVIDYFGNYPNINDDGIGVIGHSEGGMIAWMLGAKYKKNLAFIVSLAGPVVDIKDLMIQQYIDVSAASGIEDEKLEVLKNMQTEVFDAAIDSKDQSELRRNIQDIYDKYAVYFDEEEQTEYRLNQQGVNIAVSQLSSDWFKYFLKFQPSKYIKKIKSPILAMNGTLDIQVDAEQNLDALSKMINSNKCYNLEIHKMN